MPSLLTTNTLFYGDNLDILREYIADASVDLCYLDPPFQSGRDYNVLFRDPQGKESEAQIRAFQDTWQWTPATAATYHDLITQGAPHVATLVEALYKILKPSAMLAYLVMMAARLAELHRVLKPTGSLYLHCDPTAAHYLKMILDTVFGVQNFRNEIVWKRTSAHSSAKRYGPAHDVLLFYSKTDRFTWNPQHETFDPAYLASHYRSKDATGRAYTLSDLTAEGTRNGSSGLPWRGLDPASKGNHWKFTIERLEELNAAGRIYWPAKAGGWPRYIRYLDEVRGVPLQDVWTDVDPLNAKAAERLGYPTQKPLALLERILEASSNPGDMVLDPFAGCGTTVAAAQKLGRTWIGIDITHLAIALLKYRLKDQFGIEAGKAYRVIGEPKDQAGAQQLASEDRYQFQWWALSLVQAKPLGGEAGSKAGKKGSDQGIDGEIRFEEAGNTAGRVLVQVKSGHVSSQLIRDLRGTLEREKAAIGVFITLESAKDTMIKEAATAGMYDSPGWGKSYPRLQILSIADLLAGQQIQMPPQHGTFKQAPKANVSGAQQGTLGLGDA